MGATARSALTLGVLGLLLVVGAAWGWSALTQPLPDGSIGGDALEPPKCARKSVPAGTKVYPSEVTVSVFNGGTAAGLAGRTMGLLNDRDFAAGDTGNAPRDRRILRAEIWTKDKDNPAVQLVASHLGRVRIIEGKRLGVGVVVVVGDGLTRLAPGRKFVRTTSRTKFCSPILDY